MLWIHNGTAWVKDKDNTTGNNPYIREPSIGGISVTDEPIYASNTGRDANNGEMIGDFKCWKTTIEVTWPPLTYAEVKYIVDAIKAGVSDGKGYFKIKYTDIAGGTTLSAPNVEKTVYCANLPRLLYSTSVKYKRYSEVKIQFIEK